MKRRFRLSGFRLLWCLASWGCSQPADPAPPSVRGSGELPAPPSPLPREAAGSPLQGSLTFEDVAASAGLTKPPFTNADGRFRLVETMGSGVGLIDFDNDRHWDIYVLQGGSLPFDPNDRSHTSRLYRNQGDGTFRDVTGSAGVGYHGYGQGLAVGDVDRNGSADLFVGGIGRNALYLNQGDGTFVESAESAGLSDSGDWPTSCALADLDADGDLDLYVAHYVRGSLDASGAPTVRCNATPGSIGYCPPTVFDPEPDRLYRNDGKGKFTDVSGESGIGKVVGNGLGVLIADFDDDGKLDILVANDQTPNFAFRNLGGLRFEECALEWGLAFDESGKARAGMGIAYGDVDGDGRSDVLITNFYEEGTILYRNLAPGRFQVTSGLAGLLLPTRGRLGFGVGLADFDLDGSLDLFQANGHVNDVRPVGMPYAMAPQVFRNRGNGRFVEVSPSAGPYFGTESLGRGAALGDLDGDSDPDIVVTHLDRPPAVLRNTSPAEGRSSIVLRLGDAYGARIDAHVGAKTRRYEMPGGSSYLSANAGEVLIGLGSAPRAERVEVRWPTGMTQVVEGLEAGHYEWTEGRQPRKLAADHSR